MNDWSESYEHGGVGGFSAAPPKSLMEIFQSALPYYLKIGMTFDQYWDGDTSAHKAYRQAEKMRQKEANYLAWIQGAYFYEALMDAAPAIKAFCKTSARKYRDAPFDLDAEDKRKREEAEQRKRYERIKRNAKLFADAHNKRLHETPERKEEEIDNG